MATSSVAEPNRGGMAMADSPFTLTKWYLDCVTATGDAAIFYSAEIGWRGISLNCSSLLTANEAGVRSRVSMARARLGGDAQRIEVSLRTMGMEGSWSSRGRPFRTTVYQCEGGLVDWNCLQPESNVCLRVGDTTLEGKGYAEWLTTTLAPWRLPMKQLRWGRFVSDRHSLVWIDWQGSHNTSFAVLDGRQCTLRKASEEVILAEGVSLKLSERMPLRAGKLGTTVLRFAPRIKRLFPRSLASIEEHKWRSRGVLECGDQVSNGWVIHEVVHWDQ
jgi:hypothetical protein